MAQATSPAPSRPRRQGARALAVIGAGAPAATAAGSSVTTRREPAPPQAPRDPLPMCPLAAPATWTCPRPPRGLPPGGDQARASAKAIDRHRGPRPAPAGARPLRAVAGAPAATRKSPRRAAKTRSSTTSTRVGSSTPCVVTGTTAGHRVPQFRTAPISTMASAACYYNRCLSQGHNAIECRVPDSELRAPSGAGRRGPEAQRAWCRARGLPPDA